MGRALGLRRAFKHIPIVPAIVLLAVVCIWHPEKKAAAYYILRAMPFGARNAVFVFGPVARTFEIILSVHLVATHGWKLLNEYCFDPATGLWQHRQGIADAPLGLPDVDVAAGGFAYADRRRQEPLGRLREYLEEARLTFEAAVPGAGKARLPKVTQDFEHLRWFPLPGEADEGGRGRAPRP